MLENSPFRTYYHVHNLLKFAILFHFLCASACNTDTTPTQPHQSSNTHRTKNNTTNVVIQQNSRKLLMMDTLMSETCWAHKKWNKIASDIKLVFYSSTITMMHGPINIRLLPIGFKDHIPYTAKHRLRFESNSQRIYLKKNESYGDPDNA